jgi:hypothetical protein
MGSKTITVTDDQFDEAQLYADFVEDNKDSLPEGVHTFQEFVRDTGLSETTARRRLKERIEAGEIEDDYMTIDGTRQRVFWFIKD